MLPDHIQTSVATPSRTADFDSKALWQDLQNQEDDFKSEYLSGNKIYKMKRPFWRAKPVTETKQKRQSQWTLRQIPSPNREKKTIRQRKQFRPNNIKHAINLLNDSTNKRARISCLQYMDSYLRNPNDPTSITKVDTMEILKCITKTFVDQKEPIRNLSIDVVDKHIGSKRAGWDYQMSIKYIVPVIVHCILEDVYYEKSEEIRLKLAGLLDRIVSMSSNEEELKPICGDLVGILMKLLVDPYAAINKKVCSLIVALSTKIRLHTVSTMIIGNAIPLLAHRQSTVRVAAIELIECMLLNGGHEAIQRLTGFREHNVVPLEWWFGGEVRANYFGALCRHSNFSVREAFYRMIFNVMTNMRERYDYKTLLLSYVLSGLQDDNQQIQFMTFDAVEKIGAMHEKDDYNDLKRTLFFQKQAEEIKRRYLGDDDDFLLPYPFRRMVFENLFTGSCLSKLCCRRMNALLVQIHSMLLLRKFECCFT